MEGGSLSEAGGAVLFGVQFLCETDGAVAPLRGLLPTVTFHGQAVEVAIVQAAPGAGILDAEADEGSPLRFVVSLDAPAVPSRHSPGRSDQPRRWIRVPVPRPPPEGTDTRPHTPSARSSS